VIKLDWTLGLQIFNFLVLLGLLNIILYRPLRATLSKRKETIDGDHGRARDLQQQIDDKMTRYQEQLQAARLKGNEERAALRAAAAKQEAEILADAHAVAGNRLQQIKGQVADEATAARTLLQGEAGQIAGQVAARILGRSL